jgi:hypothetical protein
MPSTDVFCAFTGSIPDDADLPTDHPLEDDELADLPVGWTRITVQTRLPSPAWQEIAAVEEAMVAQVLDGVPKGQRKAATVGVRVQVAAQLAALKSQTAPYVIDTSVFHVAPGDEGAKGLAGILTTLGIEGEGADATDADDDASGEASEAEADKAE